MTRVREVKFPKGYRRRSSPGRETLTNVKTDWKKRRGGDRRGVKIRPAVSGSSEGAGGTKTGCNSTQTSSTRGMAFKAPIRQRLIPRAGGVEEEGRSRKGTGDGSRVTTKKSEGNVAGGRKKKRKGCLEFVV